MWYNFIKLGWRNLKRYKTSALINIFGLTIGLSTAFLIGIYILNEWQTDRVLPESDRTYRLLRIGELNGEKYDIGVTSPPLGPALELDFPNFIESTLRVLNGNSLVQIEDRTYQEDNYFYVDSNFIQFFGFELIHGDPKTALHQPRSVVLTRESAEKYFGDSASAMGKTLSIDNEYDVIVTGVLASIDYPIHLDFDLLESNHSLTEQDWWNIWWYNNLTTYVRLFPQVDQATLAVQLPGFMDKYFGADFERNNSRFDLKLEAIRSVYFSSDTRYDPIVHGNRKTVDIFCIAIILLILIACANYINMYTARATQHVQNIAIFRILGSSEWRVLGQSLGESFLVVVSAIIFSLLLAWFGLPWFENLLNKDIYFYFFWWQFGLALLGLAIILTLLSGFYPAWLLTTFKPAWALNKVQSKGQMGSVSLRKTLIIFQFMCSIGLIISTLVINQQLKYLQQKDLGFNKESILTFFLDNQEIYDRRGLFKERLENIQGVQSVSFASSFPGGLHDATSLLLEGMPEAIRTRTVFADFDYLKTLDLGLVSGRSFNPDLASDSTQVILLNERLVGELMMTPENILGTRVSMSSFDSIQKSVVGVVRDYNFRSLHTEIEPLIIVPNFTYGTVSVRIDPNRTNETLSQVEQLWSNLSPNFPFNYQFLDENLDTLYNTESQQGDLLSFFAFVAILIACIGMFGLVVHAASIRVKEIGIRKVLGASVTSIVALLSKDFLKLVVIAFFIISPIVWYLMGKWLEEFAYRVQIQWWLFVIAGLLTLFLVILTISLQSIKAALANPVESIRQE